MEVAVADRLTESKAALPPYLRPNGPSEPRRSISNLPPPLRELMGNGNRGSQSVACTRGVAIKDLARRGSASVISSTMSERVQRFSNTQAGSEPFGKFSTLLLFSMGYKSIDLIRSAWKRFVLIVQPLQFHYSVTGPLLLPPADFEDGMSQYTGLAVGSVASGSGHRPLARQLLCSVKWWRLHRWSGSADHGASPRPGAAAG
jgi:hypothetical protein